jgi:hypothetical protein
MTALTIIVCGCLLLAGAVAVLHAAIRAPQGYEDGQGFFEGIEPRPPEAMKTREAPLLGTADRAPPGYEDGLGSYEDVEPWPQEGLEAAEPVLSAHRASSHVHGVQ